MSGVNPTFATAINEFLTNITDININSIKNEYTDTDNIKILTDELINKGLSITKYNYNYYLNFCEEPYKIYSVMLLYILSYIFNNFKNFDDTIFSNLIDNIKLIHNYLKLIKYPKIIRDISNLNKLFENEDTTFISIYKNIDNKTIKNLLSLFIDKSNLDLSMNKILNINKEFYIVIKLIICYLNPNDYFKKFTSIFKHYDDVKIYLQYFFAFLDYEKARSLAGAIKDIIEKHYIKTNYNNETEIERINKTSNIKLNDDIKKKFDDKDIIKTVDYFHTYLKNNEVEFKMDFSYGYGTTPQKKINDYYNNDYEYLLINRDENIINLLKENIEFEYIFNIDNNSNYLLELSNKVINLNDKIYNLFGYITDKNEFKQVNDDHDDNDIKLYLSNAKLIIYKKRTTIEDTVPEKKKLTNLINEIGEKLTSKVDSTIADKLIEPVCTNINLKWHNNSCYIDSLFVALFSAKHKYMDEILYNLDVNNNLTIKGTTIINTYEYIYTYNISIEENIKNKLYYLHSSIKKELIYLYNKISMKESFDDEHDTLNNLRDYINNYIITYNSTTIIKYSDISIKKKLDTGKEEDINTSTNEYGTVSTTLGLNKINEKLGSISSQDYSVKGDRFNDPNELYRTLNVIFNNTLYKNNIIYVYIYDNSDSHNPYEFMDANHNMMDPLLDNLFSEYIITHQFSDITLRLPSIFIEIKYKNIKFTNKIFNPLVEVNLNEYNLTLQSIIVYVNNNSHYICLFKCENFWYKYDDRNDSKVVKLAVIIKDNYIINIHDLIDKYCGIVSLYYI